jgi:hypothetical protein
MRSTFRLAKARNWGSWKKEAPARRPREKNSWAGRILGGCHEARRMGPVAPHESQRSKRHQILSGPSCQRRGNQAKILESLSSCHATFGKLASKQIQLGTNRRSSSTQRTLKLTHKSRLYLEEIIGTTKLGLYENWTHAIIEIRTVRIRAVQPKGTA